MAHIDQDALDAYAAATAALATAVKDEHEARRALDAALTVTRRAEAAKYAASTALLDSVTNEPALPGSPDAITVDGETVTLPHGHHTVEEILAAAELNASKYDLLRVDRDGLTLTHRRGDTVVTARGDQFVTASIAATT